MHAMLGIPPAMLRAMPEMPGTPRGMLAMLGILPATLETLRAMPEMPGTPRGMLAMHAMLGIPPATLEMLRAMPVTPLEMRAMLRATPRAIALRNSHLSRSSTNTPPALEAGGFPMENSRLCSGRRQCP
jgi:hypothetical protein